MAPIEVMPGKIVVEKSRRILFLITHNIPMLCPSSCAKVLESATMVLTFSLMLIWNPDRSQALLTKATPFPLPELKVGLKQREVYLR